MRLFKTCEGFPGLFQSLFGSPLIGRLLLFQGLPGGVGIEDRCSPSRRFLLGTGSQFRRQIEGFTQVCLERGLPFSLFRLRVFQAFGELCLLGGQSLGEVGRIGEITE